jgi:Arc/MetJ-type ribon-helix-helix transcriptional regulator
MLDRILQTILYTVLYVHGRFHVLGAVRWVMETITIRIPADVLESIDESADEYDVTRSEYVRELIEKGREYDNLRSRLEARENRIEELEEQLARRSHIEEKVDVLAKRVEDRGEHDPPWPVRWYRWWRSE